MATLINGILGGFSGKLGNIVGYRYGTKYCIRQMPAKTLKAPTNKQLAQRAKFTLASGFMSPLRQNLNMLPAKGKKQISAFNNCFSRVLKTGISGNYPDFIIDYQALKLTSGSICNVRSGAVRTDRKGLAFSWCPGCPQSDFDGSAVALAYNLLKGQWIWSISAAGVKDRTALLEIPCNFRGDIVETYLYFISANGRAASDSIYTGAVLLPSFKGSCLNTEGLQTPAIH